MDSVAMNNSQRNLLADSAQEAATPVQSQPNSAKITPEKPNENPTSAVNTIEQTREAVASLNKFLEKIEIDQKLPRFGVEIAVSQDATETIISLVDKETGELIRQIPPKEVVEVRERLQEFTEKFDQVKGALFNNQV